MRRGKLLAAVACGYLAVCLIGGVFLAESAVHPARRVLTEADRRAAHRLAAQLGGAVRDAEIPAADGARLRAWLFTRPPGASESGAVIALHGVSDNRAGMLGFARLFLARGFDVLLPDSRAHGASGGELASYGVREAGDIGAWRRWLREERGPGCVFGVGESMGAALVLQGLEGDAPFCGVAAESPFASFREIAFDRLSQPFGAGAWLGRTALRPVAELGIAYVRLRYGVDLGSASPEDAVRRSAVPVLLVHGADDVSIPPRHSARICRGRGSIPLWQVPGCGHTAALTVAPEEFARRVVGWFRRCAADRAAFGSGGRGDRRQACSGGCAWRERGRSSA